MKVFDRIVAVAAAVALAVTFVAAGFAACAVPDATTEALSRAFSPEADSPFTKDELVKAAVATKDFTVGSHDRARLFATIADINQRAALEGRTGAGAPDLSLGLDPAALEISFAQADERYVLTPDALSHLDDVYFVVVAAAWALVVVAVLAVVMCVVVGIRGGARALGGVFLGAGAGVLVVFALLAAWVAIDFNGFFAAFHSLFFAEGTWTFSWDSLLITMYPPEFWIGMGAVWLSVTTLLCIAALVVGGLLRRKSRPQARVLSDS